MNPGLSFEELARQMGYLWKQLPEHEKTDFADLARTERERYIRERDASLPETLREYRKRHKGAPKNALSAYNFFVMENRKRVSDQHPELSFGQVARKVGEIWKSLDDETRDVYNRKHEEDQLRFRAEMDAWKEQQPPLTMQERRQQREARKRKGGPKKPCSAYVLFVADMRQQLNAEKSSMTFGETARHIAKLYKELDPNEKEVYVQRAAYDKKRYQFEISELKKKAGGNLGEASAVESIPVRSLEHTHFHLDFAHDDEIHQGPDEHHRLPHPDHHIVQGSPTLHFNGEVHRSEEAVSGSTEHE